MSGAGVTDPISFPQVWDVVIVGGVVSPGLCVVTGFKRANTWDTKKGKGTLGATSTFVEKPPAKGTLTFTAWLKEHFVAWDDFYTQFKYDPTKKVVVGVDIYHPALADIELAAILTEDISQWEHKGEGRYERTVAALEYFPTPPKPAVGTPGTAVGGTGSYTTPPNAFPGKKLDDAGEAIQKGADAANQQAATP